MIHVVLFALGALVLYRLAVLLFWVCCWLAIQPLRLLLWAFAAVTARESVAPKLPTNVIRFPRRNVL
jgi:hypothetical protein